MLTFIRAVPSRMRYAQSLAAECEGIIIAGTGSPNDDFAQMIDTLTGCERCIVLEDDAILCPDWASRKGKLPECVDVIQLWSDRASDVETLETHGVGVYNRRPSDFSGAVGLVLSSKAVLVWREAWDEWNDPKHPTAWDWCLGRAASKHGLSIGVALPSMVQHRNLPSTLGHRSRSRTSRTYASHYGGDKPRCLFDP